MLTTAEKPLYLPLERVDQWAPAGSPTHQQMGKVSHMVDRVPDAPTSSSRADALIRASIVILVAAVLGIALLFGYTIWQTRHEEKTATPAQRALVTLGDLVRKNPNSAAARVRYGEALASAGAYPDAIKQLQAAVKLDPKHTGAWLDLGLIAMQQNDRSTAESYFKKVLELTSGSSFEEINNRREQAYFHLGEIALDAKRYQDAAGYFKASIRIRKDASDSYYLLAQSFRGMGSDNLAIEQLDAALAFDPNYAEAHWLYGEILLAKGDKINAAIHLRRAADLAPERQEPQAALAKLGTAQDAVTAGRTALAEKRLAEALDSALLARALDPKSVDAALLYADVLVAKGEPKQALQVLTEAKTFAPQDAKVAAAIAAIGKK